MFRGLNHFLEDQLGESVMSTYFLLMSLGQEGRHLMHEDSEVILHAAQSSELDDVQCMGLYAVLGEYDFITVLEAPDNEAAARFSIEIGAKAGVEVKTIPAIPISRLDRKIEWDDPEGESSEDKNVGDSEE